MMDEILFPQLVIKVQEATDRVGWRIQVIDTGSFGFLLSVTFDFQIN